MKRAPGMFSRLWKVTHWTVLRGWPPPEREIKDWTLWRGHHPPKRKKLTSTVSVRRARYAGLQAVLRNIATTGWKKEEKLWIMVIHLDLLAPQQWATQAKRPQGCSSGRARRMNTSGGRKNRRWDVTSTDNRKEGMVTHQQAILDEWH
jgi:hypothetical protein